MLLLSGIGKPYDPKSDDGVVGRNYCYQTTGGATVFLDESININPFMASSANGTMIDDFGGDNFDHGPLGFIGGQYVGAIMTGGRPIEFHPTPPGTPKWGARMEGGSRPPLQPYGSHPAASRALNEPTAPTSLHVALSVDSRLGNLEHHQRDSLDRVFTLAIPGRLESPEQLGSKRSFAPAFDRLRELTATSRRQP
jgi:hypothetical protein